MQPYGVEYKSTSAPGCNWKRRPLVIKKLEAKRNHISRKKYARCEARRVIADALQTATNA
jgi:hypothetical protein